jgi:hypothetical protein
MSEANSTPSETTPPPCCAEPKALLPLGAQLPPILVIPGDELTFAGQAMRAFAYGVGFTAGALACAAVAFVVHRSSSSS